jgi:membrane protease YdiL (CAAX protease family)
MSVMVVMSLGMASAVGIAMTIAVRSGLHLASCRDLSLRFVLIIPAVSLPMLGVLATWPVESHAIKLDLPSGQTSPIGPPFTFWLFIVVAILIPFLVSYVAGRLARGVQGPPNTSLERTRER